MGLPPPPKKTAFYVGLRMHMSEDVATNRARTGRDARTPPLTARNHEYIWPSSFRPATGNCTTVRSCRPVLYPLGIKKKPLTRSAKAAMLVQSMPILQPQSYEPKRRRNSLSQQTLQYSGLGSRPLIIFSVLCEVYGPPRVTRALDQKCGTSHSARQPFSSEGWNERGTV